jgi:hypothetical protein
MLMAESEKTTDVQTDSDKEPRRRRTHPGSRAGRPTGDARRDGEQLRRNQEVLGVSGDHRTETMKRHRRGTFP